jgi:Arc/MetJ-type ribon-helix-helix transcriptional regulator
MSCVLQDKLYAGRVAASLTIRLDDAAERALHTLLETGRTRTEVVRAALLEAERAHRRAELRAWAERISADPAEVAAARALAAELDNTHAG